MMADGRATCGATCSTLACDREPNHTGQSHRGYNANLDAVMFWDDPNPAAQPDGYLRLSADLYAELTDALLTARRTRDAAQAEATRQTLLNRQLAQKIVQVEFDNGRLEAQVAQAIAERDEANRQRDEALKLAAQRAADV